MTRTLLLASAAVGAVLSSVGTAAAQSGPFDWSGFYAGIHGGVLTGDAKVVDEGTTLLGGNVFGSVGGVLAGYNFRNSPLSPNVLGVEADIGWSNARGEGGVIVDNSCDYLYDLSWDGHVRIIAGAPMGPFMPFIAGGLAIADFHVTDCGRPSIAPGGTFFGGTLGAGVNMALSQRVSARGEFLYDIYPQKRYGEDLLVSLTAWTIRGVITVKLP